MSSDLGRLVALTIVWLLIALPCVPVVMGWRALHRSTGVRVEPAAVLLLVTISYSWILLGLFFPQVLGPDYSDQRFATIGSNLAAMMVLALWAIVRGRDLRWPLLIVSLATASVWLYFLAISSVV